MRDLALLAAELAHLSGDWARHSRMRRRSFDIPVPERCVICRALLMPPWLHAVERLVPGTNPPVVRYTCASRYCRARSIVV